MKQILQELLEKPMTRKEFLRLAGVGILTVIGVGNFLSLARGQSHPSQPALQITQQNNSDVGFGSRKFGA